MSTPSTPVDRLNYSGDLRPIIERLAQSFSIGTVQDFSVFKIGFEDCNVKIITDQGRYVAKIFSKKRSVEDVQRYVHIMEEVVAAGVHHPKLFFTSEQTVLYTDSEYPELRLVLMEYIEGKTFLELNQAPNDKERLEVLHQAALINGIQFHPSYLFDSWAIPNIQSMFERTKKYINSADIPVVEKAITQFQQVPIDSLPQAFVHGDFTKANVMKTESGEIWILDFSVSNWYPRIQELAVITANLLSDQTNTFSLGEKSAQVVQEYSRYNQLTPEEVLWLYPYALAGLAMEFMGSHQEKYINGNPSSEIDFWLNLGRQGLRQALG